MSTTAQSRGATATRSSRRPTSIHWPKPASRSKTTIQFAPLRSFAHVIHGRQILLSGRYLGFDLRTPDRRHAIHPARDERCRLRILSSAANSITITAGGTASPISAAISTISTRPAKAGGARSTTFTQQQLSPRFNEFHPGDRGSTGLSTTAVSPLARSISFPNAVRRQTVLPLRWLPRPPFPLIVPDQYYQRYRGKIDLPEIPPRFLRFTPIELQASAGRVRGNWRAG